MRRIALVSLLSLLAVGSALAKKSATPVTFFGIDYSLCLFIGSGDFTDAAQVTTYYPGEWNRLLASEELEDIGKAIGPLAFTPDAVATTNAKVGPSQIIHEDGGKWASTEATVSREDREALLKSYVVGDHAGLGLVIIMDRLVKMEGLGCGWVEYFDIGSRSITAESRVCEEASGFGFRNYWFRPVKDMLDVMKKLKP